MLSGVSHREQCKRRGIELEPGETEADAARLIVWDDLLSLACKIMDSAEEGNALAMWHYTTAIRTKLNEAR